MDYVILSFLFVLIVLLYKSLPKDEIYSEGVRSVFMLFYVLLFRDNCMQTNQIEESCSG